MENRCEGIIELGSSMNMERAVYKKMNKIFTRKTTRAFGAVYSVMCKQKVIKSTQTESHLSKKCKQIMLTNVKKLWW